MFAAREINDALQHMEREDSVERIFYALQNLLNAAANIAKALWGGGGSRAQRRQRLRDSIGVGDESPLKQVIMRSNFEHIDERLDRWWTQSPNHAHSDLIIAPKSMIGLGDGHPINSFRTFDPVTWTAFFWGDEFNVIAVVEEVRRIIPPLQQEAQKPHWDPPQKAPPA
jgi:hypothetical protein